MILTKHKPEILFISSADPTYASGTLAVDYVKAFANFGYKIDLMTLGPVEGHPEYISVLEKWPKKKFSLLFRILNLLFRLLKFHIGILGQKKGFGFTYSKENRPAVNASLVVSKITKEYDWVIILFWQGLLSFKTIEEIFDKLHCQIHFYCVDYSVMSGGCHFTGLCDRYKIGCGNCPAINSHSLDDFTSYNVKYRKRIYEKVKPVVWGNSYMNSFYSKSYLLGNYSRREIGLPLISSTFCSKDKRESRKRFSIPNEKNFVMLWGANWLNDPRKGASCLFESLAIFYDMLSTEERKHVLFLTIGANFEQIQGKQPFEIYNLGYIPFDTLPYVYSSADVFVNPTINDAGPTMVNQAMACGIPVVSFEMGTAIDVVKGKGTGYCAKLGDTKDFAKGIYSLFKMGRIERQTVSERCIQVSIELVSEEAFVNTMVRAYNKYNVSCQF